MPRNGGWRAAGATESATIRMSGPGCKADMQHDWIWLTGIDPYAKYSTMRSWSRVLSWMCCVAGVVGANLDFA
jgi:hypothetical protein